MQGACEEPHVLPHEGPVPVAHDGHRASVRNQPEAPTSDACRYAVPLRGKSRIGEGALWVSMTAHVAAMMLGVLLTAYVTDPLPLLTGHALEVELVTGAAPTARAGKPDTTMPQTVPPNSASAKATSDISDAIPPRPLQKQEATSNTSPSSLAHSPRLTGKRTTGAARHAKTKVGKEAAIMPANAGQQSADAEMQGASTNNAAALLGGTVNPQPKYPELARQRGQEGQCVLRVNVDAQGRPLNVHIQKSSGHPLLDLEAVSTVNRWRFSPAHRDGAAVNGTVLVPVEFRLSN